MRDFEVLLETTQVVGPDALRSASGCTIARLPDAPISVILLGRSGPGDDARRIAEIYRRNPDPAACHDTDIAAVIIDGERRECLVVASRIGLQQVYWRHDGPKLVLGSTPASVMRHTGAAAIDPSAVHRYVYFHMSPGPATFFEGIHKLDGGHWMRWQGSGQPAVARYWRPRFSESPARDLHGAASELQEVLHEAVAKAIGEREDVGAFLSGGLDSSTVAGFASRVRPHVATVSMGFDAVGYDEMEFARIASRHFATRPLEYYVAPDDVCTTLPRLVRAFPEPFGNSSAAATYHCARVAREHGLGCLLAGDGGDELFGGNERYARQLTFERFARAPKSVRRVLRTTIERAASVTQRFPVGKALSYVRQADVALPDRLQAYNFLHRHDPLEIFAPSLLAEVDQAAPLSLLRAEYDAPSATAAVDRMLFLDWKFTLHDNDLVKVNTMCGVAGIDVAYPMLDNRVVEFSLGIPAAWKVRQGELRWFYKRAMRSFLPQAIITKTKHGFGLPFGVWTRTHEGLRRLSEDALGSLAERGFFQPAFLRQALVLHREGHASYYGELVWILMVFELWLREHLPDARWPG